MEQMLADSSPKIPNRARYFRMPTIASIDAYIAAQPTGAQAALRRVHAAIRKAIPKAEEHITYQMPTYKLNGKAVIYFAGWKAHYSLYPVTKGVAEKFAKELATLDVEKGTIRLSYDQAVPERLIAGIARLRAQEAVLKSSPKRKPKR